MFKRKNTVTINTNVIPSNILQKYLLGFPSNLPKYFKTIPKKFFDDQNRIRSGVKSLRTCSGFINLFRRSLVFNSPYDIEIFVDGENISGSVGGNPLENNIIMHPNWQFINHANSNYAFVMKFVPHVFVQSDFNIIMTNPWWHMNDFETIPGIINCKDPVELNVFIPVKKDVNKISIPQGTPLCYITFDTDKEINLNYTNEKYRHENNNGLFYKFSNLKTKLLSNILKG
tara:strand:+ start:128 stop:814 length:687 start_codon:yes stop_codon:yes gene_type:complete